MEDNLRSEAIELHNLTDAAQESLTQSLLTFIDSFKILPLGDKIGYLEGAAFAHFRMRIATMRIVSDFQRLFQISTQSILKHLLQDPSLGPPWQSNYADEVCSYITQWLLAGPDSTHIPLLRNKDVLDHDKVKGCGSSAQFLLSGGVTGTVSLNHVDPSNEQPSYQAAPVNPKNILEMALRAWIRAPGIHDLADSVINDNLREGLRYMENSALYMLAPELTGTYIQGVFGNTTPNAARSQGQQGGQMQQQGGQMQQQGGQMQQQGGQMQQQGGQMQQQGGQMQQQGGQMQQQGGQMQQQGGQMHQQGGQRQQQGGQMQQQGGQMQQQGRQMQQQGGQMPQQGRQVHNRGR